MFALLSHAFPPGDLATVRIAVSSRDRPDLEEALTLALVRLYDVDGSIEGTAALDDADGDGELHVDFVLLDPKRGPFKADLLAPTAVRAALELRAPVLVEARAGEVSTLTF